MSFNRYDLKIETDRITALLGLKSKFSTYLLLGTCAVESGFGKHFYQLNNGPARGIFQMEPNTEKDIWENHLAYREERKNIILGIVGPIDTTAPDVPKPLIWNISYQIAMARLKYRMAPEPFPELTIKNLAGYWKKFYNTFKGKGTTQHFIEAYNNHVRFPLN
jgi:hypothetical protein